MSRRVLTLPWRVALLLPLLLVLSLAGGAQSVRITLRDSATAQPVAGALVSASDSTGRVRADGLSSAAGIVTLRLPFAGSWTVGIRRIGVQPRTLAAVRVDSGSTLALRVGLQNLRYQLATVRVRADAVCGRRPDDGDRVSVLWEQITLALRAAVLSRETSAQSPMMRVTEFTRELSPTLVERASTVLRDETGFGRPFSAADPDSLASHGYIRDERDSTRTYLAPDENVLLSEAFVRTHCFSAPADAGRELAELRFKPVRGRTLPDVEGTAFVDTLSGELRSIDFRYVAGPRVIPRVAKFAGGSVTLQRILNGRWIVSHWVIRMPLLVLDPHTFRVGVSGYLERGGTVDAPEAPSPPPPTRDDGRAAARR
ncbi:MAG: carboxypeptidase regulatory-like domain-containing protein [Gemmatimonadaceae bacterium]|nr:carboxypeptidase regulatory-like domain-containing protein [Gemmatimonadaceae bacterium]